MFTVMNTTVKIGKNPNIPQGMNRQSSVVLYTMQNYSIKRKIYWYTHDMDELQRHIYIVKEARLKTLFTTDLYDILER